jgi:hypothetical protein
MTELVKQRMTRKPNLTNARAFRESGPQSDWPHAIIKETGQRLRSVILHSLDYVIFRTSRLV